MTLELLSSIKGAKPSPAVDELFMIIKGASHVAEQNDRKVDVHDKHLSVQDLRDDVVIESPMVEREFIIENFPVRKNEFLVVSKVIEGL